MTNQGKLVKYQDKEVVLRSGGDHFAALCAHGFAQDRDSKGAVDGGSASGFFSRRPWRRNAPKGGRPVHSYRNWRRKEGEISLRTDYAATSSDILMPREDTTVMFSPEGGGNFVAPGGEETRVLPGRGQTPGGEAFHGRPAREEDREHTVALKARPSSRHMPDPAGVEPEETRFFGAAAPPPLSEASMFAPSSSKESLFVPRSKPRSFVLGVFFGVLSLLMVALLCLGMFGLGTALGIGKAYIQSAPDLNLTLITDQDQSSILYDVNGDVITTMMLYRNSENASLDEIPDMLKNAFVAVEDVRFYSHSGVDLKRLASAGIGTLTGSFSGGGSTITQQLIKLQILGSEQSYRRKIQEASLALELERQYSKDEILEAYLNSVPLGSQNYGVKAAAKDYFGKDLGELTVRECSMLAGLTQNPSKYDPRLNTYRRKADSMEVTNTRTDTVIRRMYTAGFINKEQMESALSESVHIVEVSETKRVYDMPYFVEYVVQDVINCFLQERNLQDTQQNRAAIEREILTSGYRIHTTVDPDVQNTVQRTITEWKDYPALRDSSKAKEYQTVSNGNILEIPQPQAAAVVIEPGTGHIKAMIGGREEPTQRKLWNRAYQSHMEVGSSIKPLSIYAPALEMGASPANVYLNYEAPIDGYGGERGYPKGGLKSQGPVTMREGVRRSLNVVAARTLYETVGIERSVQTLEQLGVPAGGINPDGPGLALGTSGVSPLEMAAAYATLANGGTYLEPISFTRVESSGGGVILEAEKLRERRQVFSPATAWLITDMLEEAVNAGTGTRAKISGMHVAGKTGTNSDYRSVYFAGYTPYYASSLWIGHDDGRNKLKSGASGGTFAAPLWQAYMEEIHEGKADREFFEALPEELGLVQREICSVSGQLATDACRLDAGHKPVTDWVLFRNAPVESCTMHRRIQLAESTGKMLPPDAVETGKDAVVTVVPNDGVWGSISNEQMTATLTNAMRSNTWSALQSADPDSELYKQYYDLAGSPTDLLNEEPENTDELLAHARELLDGDYIMTEAQRESLMTLLATIDTLRNNGTGDSMLETQISSLRSLVGAVKAQNRGEIPREDPEEGGLVNEYGEVYEID